MTMRQVAKHAGLSLSNVQYHFKSPEDLLVGVTEHHLAECSAAMQTALGPAETPTLRSVLRASLCDEGVRSAAPAFRELFAKAQTEPAVRQKLNEYYQRMFETSVERLRGTLPKGRRSRKRVEEVVTVLMTSIEGAYLLEDVTPVAAKRLATVLEQVATTMLEDS